MMKRAKYALFVLILYNVTSGCGIGTQKWWNFSLAQAKIEA
jgi:hypothetical protein